MNFLKKYWVPISFVLLCMGLSFTAPDEAARSQIQNPAQQQLSTSSSLDTADFDFGEFYSSHYYALQLNADSISGATGATCYLQLNSDMGESDWVAIETMTINGVTTRLLETGEVMAGTLRCRCIAPSSTQVTNVRVDLVSDKK